MLDLKSTFVGESYVDVYDALQVCMWLIISNLEGHLGTSIKGVWAASLCDLSEYLDTF